jgi:hypothetical protein
MEKLALHSRAGSWFTLLSMDPASQTRPFDLTYPNGLPGPDWNFPGGAVTSAPPTSSACVTALADRIAKIVAAFERTPLTTSEAKTVKALMNNPGAAPLELSAAIESESSGAWQLLFGRLCRRREADLWPAPPAFGRRTPGGDISRFYTGILADWDLNSRTFTMKPEAIEAFSRLGCAVHAHKEPAYPTK